MQNSHQETSAATCEVECGGPALSKQKKVIHFSSGETLELEDSEEEEEEEEEQQLSNSVPFKEPAQRTKFSFKNVAILVGRISLLACDFLGERLAGALGLNAAKYQYAIDEYHRDQKTQISRDSLREEQAESIHLSPGLDGSRYGATGDESCPADPQESCDEKHVDRKKGCHNRGYQADEDYLE
ncbi:protein FAM177B-like [Stegastes partitus]|uniref:Protein FAM177B-like n=1 Tax=Stegastes partitus TaxID=144197 RepID=A0A9Y4U2V0_9TELE|nr:PREDICTED: protein FAM177B-like [Stegastes partitus]